MSFRDEIADDVEEMLKAKYGLPFEEYLGYSEVAGGTGYFAVRNKKTDEVVIVEVNWE